jgi:hypothetical protein
MMTRFYFSTDSRHSQDACGELRVSRNTVLLVVSCLYVLISVISAVPAFAKHSSHMPLLVLGYGAFLIVLVLCVAQNWRWPVGDRIGWIATALVLLAFAIAAWRLYPPTRDVVPRSSAPDALIAPATRLLSGTNPYSSAVGVDGVPASPGPAWILVHAPVTVSGLIWLMSVAHLALLSTAVGLITRSGRAALSVVVLMLAMPSFLQASFTGQDLFAAGCALTAVTLMLFASQRASWHQGWLLWVAAGVVATARAPLALDLVILATLLWWNRQHTWQSGFGIAFSVVALSHGLCWAWARHDGVAYQPFHVFHRAGETGPWWLVAGVILTCCASAAMFRWSRRPAPLSEWLLLSWVAMGIPFAFVGAGELFLTAGTLGIGGWEGKTYVSFLAPLLATALVVESAASPGGRMRLRESAPAPLEGSTDV